ncbi:MAG: FmdB family zinc ribbon protein [Thermodesulfovibrionales bacterium]
MPVYEYECKACKQTCEVMQRFDDPPLETCAVCGGQMQKLVSNTSFVLKGSGWYVTDYVRKSETTNEKSNGSKSTETKTDTTPTDSNSATTEAVAKTSEVT